MAIGQITRVSLPYPSQWTIQANIGRRPRSLGTLFIQSVSGSSFSGAVNFRGTMLPIQGYWNESASQIAFETPYASFNGHMTFFDEQSIHLRHYVLRGTVRMKPPSVWAGEYGTWTATYEAPLV